MRTKNYYKVRTVVRVIFWASVALAFYHVVTHIWWTDNGYCWGTLVECMLEETK